jgi:hypothetical protein
MAINFPGVAGVGMPFVPNMPNMGPIGGQIGGPIGMMSPNPIMAQNKGIPQMMGMGSNVPPMGGMMGVPPPMGGQ